MTSPLAVLDALWITWLGSWLLAAGLSKRTVVNESAGGLLTYSVFIWIGAIVWLRSSRIPPLDRPLLPHLAWLSWFGVAIAALGFATTGWARLHLGKLWSANVTLKEGHTIVRTGPYGLVRHPIYTGLLFALIGSVLVWNNLGVLLGVALMIVGGSLKIRQEENLLLEHFGNAYREYQRDVPPIIPHPKVRR
jgi:protein-S-isoprenylcysteine O-methyltransferase Ste14